MVCATLSPFTSDWDGGSGGVPSPGKCVEYRSGFSLEPWEVKEEEGEGVEGGEKRDGSHLEVGRAGRTGS